METGKDITIKELAAIIKDILGYEGEVAGIALSRMERSESYYVLSKLYLKVLKKQRIFAIILLREETIVGDLLG